ncbi:unnamed protein product [Angiostrongylus costaricensis]|uniref:HTH_48 domain-containing protein n=1 Tax=Angiostrongylus costaricensis TaxID=334426 RepID=A0A0R3PZ16_ANGCS|nr:unnamed protein product [Angiostrongylus costaricensis]
MSSNSAVVQQRRFETLVKFGVKVKSVNQLCERGSENSDLVTSTSMLRGSGRPTELDDDELKALVKANTRTTARELTERLGVSSGTISPELNDNQKNRRFGMPTALILQNKNDPFIDRTVTYDEKWILYDNRQLHLNGWIAIRLLSTSHSQNCTKKGYGDCLVACSEADSWQLLNPGEMITAEKYCQQIDEIHRKLQQQQPVLVNRKGPILLHDNAQPHVLETALQKLNELGYETLFHLPYSSDLSPTDSPIQAP